MGKPLALMAAALLCLLVQTGMGAVAKVEERKVEAIPIELPPKPLPKPHCRLSSRDVGLVNGCKPSSPVYQTSCSGSCPSTYTINPLRYAFSASERCTCCKPTLMKSVKVDLSCPAYTMTATCDNNMKVYFDGNLQSAPIGELNNWGTTSTFSVPANTQVVAIECEDLHVVAGILASFDNGIVTDDGWHCSAVHFTDWTLPGFGPTSPSWNPAYEIGANGGGLSSWGVLPGISSSAQWIWTSNWTGGDTKVYCRRVMQPALNVFAYQAIEECGCQTCRKGWIYQELADVAVEEVKEAVAVEDVDGAEAAVKAVKEVKAAITKG